ncbi:MAG: T9SS type A sorting domain-containing protein, partial [Bacteroidota bacterium]
PENGDISFEVIQDIGSVRVISREADVDNNPVPPAELYFLEFRVIAPAEEADFFIDPTAGPLVTANDLMEENFTPAAICSVLPDFSGPTNITASIAPADSCDAVPAEAGLAGWNVRFTSLNSNDDLTAVTFENGRVNLQLLPGNYVTQWSPPGNLNLWEDCNDLGDIFIVPDTVGTIFLKASTAIAEECQDNFVEISSGNLRPCFDNNVFLLYYGNAGTIAAPNAFIDVAIDERFTPLMTSLPFTLTTNNRYRFFLDDLAPNQTGFLRIEGLLDCDFPVGQAVCAEAKIFPTNKDCVFNNPLYEGGELEVTSACDGESVQFSIENIGEGPSGMVGYRVIADDLVLEESTLSVAAGATEMLSFVATGATFRLEIDRPVGAPFQSRPLGIEEGCGNGDFSTGFVNSLNLLDEDIFFDRYCLETTAAYDPNDKLVSPGGVGPDNWVLPNQKLDYKIRFQNTGTDTAFTVVLLDTLDTEVLAASTLHASIASHPYTFTLKQDSILEVRFENILLPDSTTNEPASNGFIHFTIDQQPDLADGTLIQNRAGIYFDFNAPIITEYSMLTVQRELLVSKVASLVPGSKPVTVYPSPTRDYLNFEWEQAGAETLLVKVYDIFGRAVLQDRLNSSEQRLDLATLQRGRYVYQLMMAGQTIQAGIVVKL